MFILVLLSKQCLSAPCHAVLVDSCCSVCRNKTEQGRLGRVSAPDLPTASRETNWEVQPIISTHGVPRGHPQQVSSRYRTKPPLSGRRHTLVEIFPQKRDKLFQACPSTLRERRGEGRNKSVWKVWKVHFAFPLEWCLAGGLWVRIGGLYNGRAESWGSCEKASDCC